MTRSENPEPNLEPTEANGQRGSGGETPPVTVRTERSSVVTDEMRSAVVTDDLVRPEEPEAAPEEPAAPAPAPPPAAPEATQREPSGNGAASATAPPWQRQRTVNGDGDPKTVNLKVGPPEHARGAGAGASAGAGAGREQAERQPVIGRTYGFSPGTGPAVAGGPNRQQSVGEQGSRTGEFSQPTVRIGGYTPPEPASPRPAASTRVNPGRVPRRANLQLQRLEPWSVLKLSLVLSIAGFFAWMVAVGLLYGVLAGMGVWDQLNGTYSDLTSVNNPQADTELISGGRVFGVAIVVGLVNIVLFTAMATVGSFVYNVGADLVGGVEVTLSESD